MTDPRFDEARSAAIRDLLMETVRQSPRREHARQVRMAVLAVLVALAAALGSTAVAAALTGTDLFGLGAAPAPATVEPSTTAPGPTSTATPTPAAPTRAPHPLVVTDGFVAPRDLLTAPVAAWTLDLPGDYGRCDSMTITDVGDGFALVQRGPAHRGDQPNSCDFSQSRLGLSLVDTSTGDLLWSRDWAWAFDDDDTTTAQLLGTSGRVLLWGHANSTGPREVIDLASGSTLATVELPAGLPHTELNPVPGSSGDVTLAAERVDASGQATGTWVAMRADPRTLGDPVWSRAADGYGPYTPPLLNSSSVVQFSYTAADGRQLLDVLDVDTGAPMVQATADRSYLYLDGVTLRESDFTELTLPRTVAGIDDAGNEFWSRTLDSGYRVSPVRRAESADSWQQGILSDVALIGPGTRIELIDGLTGQTLWTADAAACANEFNTATGLPVSLDFVLASDGVLISLDAPQAGCGLDRASGAPVDVSARTTFANAQGTLVSYVATGGHFNGPVVADPRLTALDAVTGTELWQIPQAEWGRWEFAGGYLVQIIDQQIVGYSVTG